MGDSGTLSFFHKLRLRVHRRLSRSMRAGLIDRRKKLLLASAGIIALLSEFGQRGGSCQASAGLHSAASGRCRIHLDGVLRRGQRRRPVGERHVERHGFRRLRRQHGKRRTRRGTAWLQLSSRCLGIRYPG